MLMERLYLLYACIFLFSLLMGALLLPRIIHISAKRGLADEPDHRKIHTQPIPRLGGISFLPIIMMSVLLFNILCVLWLKARVTVGDTGQFLKVQTCTLGIFLLYLVGVADDLVGANFKSKFAAQFAAACLFPLIGLRFHNVLGLLGLSGGHPFVDYAFTVFMVVYIVNAINLIDGVDGLASGICILTFSLYTLVFIYLHHPFLAALCLAALGVLSIFFLFNVFGREGARLKKLFMGDTGSLTLGYLISFCIFSLTSHQNTRALEITGVMYMAFAPLVIPLLDIIRVVHARYCDRVPLFQPDKRHIHHKLLRTGLPPRKTMVTLLLLTLYFILINILLPWYLQVWWVVLCNLASWLLLHYVINHFIRRRLLNDPLQESRYANPKNTIAPHKYFDL